MQNSGFQWAVAMRILVLSKRQYTNKDLLDDRYGRVFEIPSLLAQRGHDVRGVALSYRRRSQGWHTWKEFPGMRWWSENAFPSGLAMYGRVIAKAVAGWPVDVIWAGSDVLQVALAYRWSQRHGVPLVVDLYDNYESFGLARVPVLPGLFRKACINAAGVTTVSRTLADHVMADYGRGSDSRVIVNGVRDDFLLPRDKVAARAELGLPIDAKLLGTAGSLTSDRGISDLFDAFLRIAGEDQSAWLVVAGPRDGTIKRYRHPRIIDLGTLALEQVPSLIGALDVAVVCNRDSEFGRYCFPLKLHEIIACGTPVVVAAVGDVARLLVDSPDCLYSPGNVEQLAGKIKHQMVARVTGKMPVVPTWRDCAVELEDYLEKTLEKVNRIH